MRSGRNWQGMQYLSMNSNFQGCILRICKNLWKTHKPTHLLMGTYLVMMLLYLGPFLTCKPLWKCTQTQKRQDLIRCFINWNAPLSFTWNQTATQADQQRKLPVENGASSLFDLSPSVPFTSVWRWVSREWVAPVKGSIVSVQNGASTYLCYVKWPDCESRRTFNFVRWLLDQTFDRRFKFNFVQVVKN